MNSRHVLHQTVHGYSRGHEILAASVELDSQDLDRLAQLSDLSGFPVSATFPPYLTCYPLPSCLHYAFACTWPDPDAPREGCVLTHTILIPMDAWITGGVSAAEVVHLHTQPKRSDLREFLNVLHTDSSSSVDFSFKLKSVEAPQIAQRLTASYFVNGNLPVILLGSEDFGRDLIPAFADMLWPNLRSRFAACSYALQPRQLGNNSFDLLFAPIEALSKYSRVPESQIIRNGNASLQGVDERIARLAETVFQSLSDRLLLQRTYDDDAWAEMPSDPTALYRLSIFDDLRERSANTPSSAIAALDVLGGLFPLPSAALKSKESALGLAMKRAKAQPIASQLEYLAAIALRCSKLSFGSLRKLRRDLIKEITRISVEMPLAALQAMSRSKGRNAPLYSGVGKSMAVWGTETHELLGDFGARFPTQMEALLRYSPEAVANHLMAMDGDIQRFKRGTVNILNWYDQARPYVRSLIAKSIVSSPLFAQDDRLVTLAIQHAGVRQLDAIFSALLVDASDYALVQDDLQVLACRFPVQARESILRVGIQTDLAALLFASTLPISLDGLEILDSIQHIGYAGYTKVSAAFVRLPSVFDELNDEIRNRSTAWLALWLDGNSIPSRSVLASAVILLQKFENLELALQLDPLRNYYFEADSSSLSLLGNSVLRSVACLFVRGKLSEDILVSWLRNILIASCIKEAEDLGLWQVLISSGAEQLDGHLVWKFVRIVAVEFEAVHRKVPPLSLKLVSIFKSSWNNKMTEEWVKLLAHIQGLSRQASRIEIDALRIALKNSQLPLADIVARTFARVYRFTAPKASLSLFEMLWATTIDSGLPLRRELIAAFLESSWPPSTLAIVAVEAGIAEKIFEELATNNRDYMLKVAKDLKGKPFDKNLISKINSAIPVWAR